MHHMSLKEKVMNHLSGINEVERKTDSDNIVKMLAERYDTDQTTIERILAEWSSGRKKQ